MSSLCKAYPEDFHVHSTFSDGKDSPRALVEEALRRGMTDLGLSDHSYTVFDGSYCMPKDRDIAYRDEVARLREEFAGKIRIRCGIEQDYDSSESTAPYDYAIGSVHYIRFGNDYCPVDDGAQYLVSAADSLFDGDIYRVIEAYYAAVSDVLERTGAQIIGHLDLIRKYNGVTPFFDPQNPRYIQAWQTAADRLLKYNVPFEINTSPIARGLGTEPYPAAPIRRYIAGHGGTFVLTSDSHRAENLQLLFEECLTDPVTKNSILRFSEIC